MVFLTGYTSDTRYLHTMQELGWGRMLCERYGPPAWAGEPLGVDNGAFTAWNDARERDWREYLEMLAVVGGYGVTPYLAVVPDKVADSDSLRFSMAWLERLSEYPWPWYLAVQDGMTVQQVETVVPHFAGLFLGGTKRWKRATARQWAQVAHERGLRAHYARCSGEDDLRHAERCAYDSADSTFLLWTRGRFQEFVGWWNGKGPQGVLGYA